MVVPGVKALLATLASSHPYAWFVGWGIVDRLPCLLPHEKTYYGFRHLAPGQDGLFLDVGANNGCSALGFRRLVPHYRILSIEPNRCHEPALARLTRTLGRFEYLIVAAGRERGEAVLHTAMYRGVHLHTSASLSLDYSRTACAKKFSRRVMDRIRWTRQVVEVVPLDDLQLKPDLVKIDAEGFDHEVLLGLRRTLTNHRPCVLVEYGPELREKLEAFCDDLGYVLFSYDHRRDHFSRFDAARAARARGRHGTTLNVFLIPSERVPAIPTGEGRR